MSKDSLEVDPHENPAGWPAQIIPMVARALTCNYASLTQSGRPITWPLTPFVNDDRRSIDVSTGLVYPEKAERARANPKVALLFSDQVGLTLKAPPTVLVLGRAAVRDADLQANADRYVKRSFRKLPAAMRQIPWPVVRAQAWYLSRIWIEVTPLRIYWWQHHRLDEQPRSWVGADAVDQKNSDPEPPGRPPGPWQTVEGDWKERAAHAIGRIGNPVLTFVHDGWPVPVPVSELRAAPDGFSLRLPDGLPFVPDGSVCVTFQTHAEKFVGQDNAAFVGTIEPSESKRAGAEQRGDGGGRWHVLVDRRLGDFTLPGGAVRRTRSFLSYGRALKPRLEAECLRRNQPVPSIRHPKQL